MRQIYDHTDPALAVEWVAAIGRDSADTEMPPEVRRLGRTIARWSEQICAWHRSHVTTGPTEAVILWSPVGGVFHVLDEGCRDRGGRVLWSDVVMVADGAARVG